MWWLGVEGVGVGVHVNFWKQLNNIYRKANICVIALKTIEGARKKSDKEIKQLIHKRPEAPNIKYLEALLQVSAPVSGLPQCAHD